jgi:hypothetical protein
MFSKTSRRLVVVAALGCAVMLAASALVACTATAEGGSGVICQAQVAGDVHGSLEYSLSPASGATVVAGAPVTFSGRSEAPLTFAVASSPASLPSPDIDSGLGFAMPFSEQAGPQTSFIYTFTSSAAAKAPGTVYWQASLSTADIESCAGLAPVIWRTSIRALTIVPAPVQASIEGPTGFAGAQSTISYGVRCTISCTGDTYFQTLVLSHHEVRRIPSLDFGPAPVAITAGSGGSELFARHYKGSALRALDKLIRAHALVEIEINVKVTDANGNVVRAHTTAGGRPRGRTGGLAVAAVLAPGVYGRTP